MSIEEWRPFPSAVQYEVSSLGRVRHSNGHIRKLLLNIHGRPFVNINIGGHTNRSFRVHRAVAIAFLGEPPQGHEVNHKDGDKTNNQVSNLEWVTKSENHLHRFRVLGQPASGAAVMPMRGEANPHAKVTEQIVREVRALKGVLKSHEVAPQFGITASHVRELWTGRTWKGIP